MSHLSKTVYRSAVPDVGLRFLLSPLLRSRKHPRFGADGSISREKVTNITADIVAKMVERYPDWGNLHTLWHSAKTAIARKGS